MIFLGHALSADGIPANAEKVDEVRDWPVPNNKILHSILALPSDYHQFIPNYAHVASSLHQLTGLTNVKKSKDKKKEVTTLESNQHDKKSLVWLSEYHRALDALKTALTTAAVLGYLDFTKEFILDTVAS